MLKCILLLLSLFLQMLSQTVATLKKNAFPLEFRQRALSGDYCAHQGPRELGSYKFNGGCYKHVLLQLSTVGHLSQNI